MEEKNNLSKEKNKENLAYSLFFQHLKNCDSLSKTDIIEAIKKKY